MRKVKWFNVLLVVILLFIVAGATSLFLNSINVDNVNNETQSIVVDDNMFNDKWYEAIEVFLKDININNNLILVNSKNSKKDNDGVTLSSGYKVVPVFSTDIELEENTLKNLDDMFLTANKIGFKDFFVNSAYRSYEDQKKLYMGAENKNFVQKAGSSEHITGLAVDIGYKGVSNLGNSKEGKWLAKNAHKYGFILRYPKDKEDITNISYEPWHFRYVGIPHAYYSYSNNMCLEEYIEFLVNISSYTVTIDDQTYGVYRTVAKNKKIKVPKDEEYFVSKDNIGGYIVTVLKDGK